MTNPDRYCKLCGRELICDIYPRYSTKTGKLIEYHVDTYCPLWAGRGVNHHYFKPIAVYKDSIGFYKTIERQTPKPFLASISPNTLRLWLACTAIIIVSTALVIVIIFNQ